MPDLRRFAVSLIAACMLATMAGAHPGSGIAVDRSGNVYFVDTGSGLWKLDSRGALSRQSTSRFHWLALDERGRFADAKLPSGASGDIESVGEHPTVLISSDYPILVDQAGRLYYQDRQPTGLRMIRRTPTGTISNVATLAAQPEDATRWVNGLAAAPDGSIYFTDKGSIRRIDGNGQVVTVATVKRAPGNRTIPGIPKALGPYLRGLAIDAHGVVFVACSGDGRVLKIAPGGKVTTLVQTESPWSPTAVALHGRDLYVLEYVHTADERRLAWIPRVRKVTPDGRSRIVARVEDMPGARS